MKLTNALVRVRWPGGRGGQAVGLSPDRIELINVTRGSVVIVGSGPRSNTIAVFQHDCDAEPFAQVEVRTANRREEPVVERVVTPLPSKPPGR